MVLEKAVFLFWCDDCRTDCFLYVEFKFFQNANIQIIYNIALF